MEIQQKEKYEQFLADAYGCVRCTVEMEKLDADAIESIRRGLREAQPNLSKPNLDGSGN